MGGRAQLVFLLSSLAASAAAAIFDLGQLDWTLKNQNGSIQIPVSGPPSHVHLELAKAGIITEPLLGINDFTERWVADDNWTYTADLEPFNRASGLSLEAQSTLLVFYGIDTVANITLRGRPVAWVDNQFRQWIFDVSEQIESDSGTDNNLTVAIQSAYHYGLNVSTLPGSETFPGNWPFEYPTVWPWLRKVPDDFGWDWGPAFVPSGIHKPAYLVTLSSDKKALDKATSDSAQAAPGSVFLEESSIDIFKRGQSFSNQHPDQTADWIVNVSLAIRTPVAISKAVLSVSFPELHLTSKFDISDIPASTKEPFWISAVSAVSEGVPQRWYPHDLGTGPKLYDIVISLDNSAGKLVDLATKTGFRTIVIIQTPYSDAEVQERGIIPGDQWHFEINGKPFFAKGTNLIPFDPFYPRIPTDRVRWILESAVKSGQNMLRVWGGGAYQPSSAEEAGGVYDFYSICDELGILAWSELIFSDALYPINEFLLETIEPEVRQNVRRVNRHPSNAQWAAGNEIEGIAIWTRNWENNGKHYFDEYVELFQKFLYNAVTSESKSVPYTDCSTTHGVLSLDPYELRFENGTSGYIYGNAERFNYDAPSAFDYSTYPVARFVNEFGFHSMPSFYSWLEALESPEDFSFNSSVVQSRTHHPPAGGLQWPNPNSHQGHEEMTNAVEMWLPTPNSGSDTNQTFAQWCYSTQVFQAMTMVSQVAFYRSGAGKGENNLGSLIWQLNDIWQGVSWSAIEHSGRWKVLNYGLAGIYSPVVVYPFWTASNQSLEVLTISDRWEEVKGSVQLTWFDWVGRPLNISTFEFTTPSLNNSVILEAVGLTNILPVGRDAKDVWLLLNLTAEIDRGKVVKDERYFTPTSLADAHLIDPKIEVTRGEGYTFTLSAKGGVAPWTWIDHPAGTVGVFVDAETGHPTNGFYLIPGLDRTLRFELNPSISTNRNPDPADFVVRSLWSSNEITPQPQPKPQCGTLRSIASLVLGVVFFGAVGGHVVNTRKKARAEEEAKARNEGEREALLGGGEDRAHYGAAADAANVTDAAVASSEA